MTDRIDLEAAVAEAHARFRDCGDGANATAYPALQQADPTLFGVALARRDGRVAVAGDADRRFAIMSAVKPFVFALLCQELGPEAIAARIGVNATGLPFNSATAIERSPDGRTNPMVNSGAIATTSLAPGGTTEAQWDFLRGGLSGFAGRDLRLDDEVYRSSAATNHRNQSLARLLKVYDRIAIDPAEATELYTRQSALAVSARDLALMGATLASGGRHPLTGAHVVDAASCRHALVVMATAGLYETSGDWLYQVGLPGKSGIGGGIVTVAPGWGALGTFSPRLDAAGNSVRGQLVARHLSRQLGLDLFAVG